MRWVEENAASKYNGSDIAVQIVSLVFSSIPQSMQLLRLVTDIPYPVASMST